MMPPRLAPPPVVPITHGWTEHKAPDGRPYYYNSITRVSSYDKPDELKTPHERAAAAAKAAPVVVAAAAASAAPTAKAPAPVPATATPTPATAAQPAAVAAPVVPPAVAATVTPPVAPKPAAPVAPVVIPKCKWKAYDGPGGRKYYSDGKSSLWEKPKELKDYEAAVAAAAEAAKLNAAAAAAAKPVAQPAPAAESASASPVATMAASEKPASEVAAAETPAPAVNGEPEAESEPVVELVGFGGANGVALKVVEETPASPEKPSSPGQTNGSGSSTSKAKNSKKKAVAVQMEYETPEQKKEAFIEMLKECEVTSTTKVRRPLVPSVPLRLN